MDGALRRPVVFLGRRIVLWRPRAFASLTTRVRLFHDGVDGLRCFLVDPILHGDRARRRMQHISCGATPGGRRVSAGASRTYRSTPTQASAGVPSTRLGCFGVAIHRSRRGTRSRTGERHRLLLLETSTALSEPVSSASAAHRGLHQWPLAPGVRRHLHMPSGHFRARRVCVARDRRPRLRHASRRPRDIPRAGRSVFPAC